MTQESPPDEAAELYPFEFPARPLRTGQCSRYLRRVLAAQLPHILSGLVAEARKGSCQHIKLAVELLAPQAEPARPVKGSAEKLLERWADLKEQELAKKCSESESRPAKTESIYLDSEQDEDLAGRNPDGCDGHAFGADGLFPLDQAGQHDGQAGLVSHRLGQPA